MSKLEWLRAELAGLFDLLFPPVCLVCREQSAAERRAMLCGTCHDQLPNYQGASCSRCALPFSANSGSHRCEACLRHPPAYSNVYYHGLYKGLLRDTIQRFKYDEDIVLARTLGRLLAISVSDELSCFKPDVIVPVPLHHKRLQQRGFNQALLLARELARPAICPVSFRALRRIKPTATQKGLKAQERRRNVRGAFEVNEPLVEGKRVLLVDDVMTTGATLHECARMLRQAGVTDVAAAVIARVDREPEMLFE